MCTLHSHGGMLDLPGCTPAQSTLLFKSIWDEAEMDKRPSLVTQEIQSLRILASKCMLIFLIYSHSHLPKATHLLNSNIFFHAAVGSQDAHIWLASWHNTCASATLDVLYYWLISLLGWACFAHFHFPLWTCRGASFHQLVQRACPPKRTQQRNVRVLCTLQLLWQGPETKIVLAAVLANPKPTHPTRQLSQLLTCTSRHGYVRAASLSYSRISQAVFSNIRAFSLEFSSAREQESVWAWSMSSNCLLFKGLCCGIALFGC